jgi:hypothetical protein
MRIQNLLEELQNKPKYKTFQSQNPDTFFAAAFLILDLENETEQIQLDFFLPQQNKIATFSHPFSQPKIHEDKIENMQPQTTEIKIDIDHLEEKCKQLIKENNHPMNPTKIIAILRDDIWNLTCMDNALGITRIKINAISEKLKTFDKGSLTDFMRIDKK